MEQPKPFYKSKTVVIYGLTLAGAILSYILSDQFPFELTPEVAAAGAVAMSIGGMVLRAVSSGEIYFTKPKGDQ